MNFNKLVFFLLPVVVVRRPEVLSQPREIDGQSGQQRRRAAGGKARRRRQPITAALTQLSIRRN